MKITPEQALEVLFATVILGSLGWLGNEVFDLNGRLNKLEGRLDTIVEIRGEVQSLEKQVDTLHASLGIPSVMITSTPAETGDLMSKGSIGGTVEGVKDLQEHRIVVYALTDKWYVQPMPGEALTPIGADGSWHTWTHSGSSYAALLVGSSYKPPPIAEALPTDAVIASTIRRATEDR